MFSLIRWASKYRSRVQTYFKNGLLNQFNIVTEKLRQSLTSLVRHLQPNIKYTIVTCLDYKTIKIR